MNQKLNMCAKRLEPTFENIYMLETLRFMAYGLEGTFNYETFYSLQMQNEKIIPFGFYINGKLAAGCYVSDTYNTLYIDQLFVHPLLQNSGLRAGRLLLNYVLANKAEIQEHFKKEFEISALEPSNDKAKAIYKKMGYKNGDLLMRKKLSKNEY